jgi:hypothetical protein
MGGEVKLPASILESKAEYNPFAHAVGNFSECRSAVRTLLQKGQGRPRSYTSSLFYSFSLCKKGCLTFELCSVLRKKP